MNRYVGSTSRSPDIRKREWLNEGYNVSQFKVIARGLTYEQAKAMEDSYKRRGYTGHVYSVYTF